MKTYMSGQSVPYGVYASLKPLDLRFAGAEGEILDGRDGTTYTRLPAALVLLLAYARIALKPGVSRRRASG